MPCLCSDYFMRIFKTPFHHETGTPVDAIVTAVGLQHSEPPPIDQSDFQSRDLGGVFL